MADYRYDHVHIISADPEAAGDWFVDKFGATIKGKSTGPDGSTMVMVDLNGANIFVKGRATPPSVEAPPPGSTYGLEHFGVVTDDLDSAVAELKSKGVTFTQDITDFRPGIRISFLLGPDNVLIELLERKPA